MWRHSQLPIAWNTSKDGDVAKITQIPSVLRDADVFTKTKPLLAPTSVDKDTIAYTDLEHGKKLNNVEFKATGKTIVQDDSLNLDEHTRIAAEESFLNGLFFGSQEPFNMRFNGNGLNYLSNEERESLKKGFLELSNRRNFRNLGPVLQRRVIENRASDENEDSAKNVTLPEFIFFHCFLSPLTLLSTMDFENNKGPEFLYPNENHYARIQYSLSSDEQSDIIATLALKTTEITRPYSGNLTFPSILYEPAKSTSSTIRMQYAYTLRDFISAWSRALEQHRSTRDNTIPDQTTLMKDVFRFLSEDIESHIENGLLSFVDPTILSLLLFYFSAEDKSIEQPFYLRTVRIDGKRLWDSFKHNARFEDKQFPLMIHEASNCLSKASGQKPRKYDWFFPEIVIGRDLNSGETNIILSPSSVQFDWERKYAPNDRLIRHDLKDVNIRVGFVITGTLEETNSTDNDTIDLYSQDGLRSFIPFIKDGPLIPRVNADKERGSLHWWMIENIYKIVSVQPPLTESCGVAIPSLSLNGIVPRRYTPFMILNPLSIAFTLKRTELIWNVNEAAPFLMRPYVLKEKNLVDLYTFLFMESNTKQRTDELPNVARNTRNAIIQSVLTTGDMTQKTILKTPYPETQEV